MAEKTDSTDSRVSKMELYRREIKSVAEKRISSFTFREKCVILYIQIFQRAGLRSLLNLLIPGNTSYNADTGR